MENFTSIFLAVTASQVFVLIIILLYKKFSLYGIRRRNRQRENAEILEELWTIKEMISKRKKK